MEQLKTPVLLIVFRRLDTTKRVLEAIRKVKPQKLYIASDYARKNNDKEVKKVLEVRKYVEENIDWDCKVEKDYAEENYGSRKRVSSAISCVLSNEEEVIVIEDDIVPVPDFFEFCREMLDYYRDDERVMMISGNNNIKGHIDKPYTFSCFSGVWGWATWKRAWKYYDDSMKDWPKQKKTGELKYVMPGLSYLFMSWNNKYVYNREMDAWDFVWDNARFKMHGLGIVPKTNLIRNIGFESDDATNTLGKSKYKFECGSYSFPLEKIEIVERNLEYDKAYIRQEYPGWKALLIWIKKTILFVPRRVKKDFFCDKDDCHQ